MPCLRVITLAAVLIVVTGSSVRAKSAASLGDNPANFDQQFDFAYLHRDAAFIDAVVDVDPTFTHGSGVVWDKQQLLNSVRTYEGRARDVDSVQVERHGDIVETIGHVRKAFADTKQPDSQIYYVRLYVRRAGHW